MMTEAPKVRLGELIEECGKRNSDGLLGADDVIGMTITKEIIPTKADVKNTDLSKFLIVEPEQFVYNPRTHGKKIGLGFNDTTKQFLISWNNSVFRVKNPARVIAKFLYLTFSREEWDRNACFRSWGSSTEVFSWSEFSLMEIPLPDIDVQRDLVAIYGGLQKIVAENEALIAQLESVCHDFVVDCKSKYPKVKLGNHIEECDERNSDGALTLDDVRGISIEKKFIFTKADMAGVSLTPYKVVKKGWFCYVPVTSRNGEKISLAIYGDEAPAIVSATYYVFRSRNEEILHPEYLYLLFKRSEFDRYARFNSWGSARETFDLSEMRRVEIPLPPIDIQRSIAAVARCLSEAKRIVADARELMKNLCPALVQKAAHSV